MGNGELCPRKFWFGISHLIEPLEMGPHICTNQPIETEFFLDRVFLTSIGLSLPTFPVHTD